MPLISPNTEPIAVIGSSCRFPGGINSTSKLWEVICAKEDLQTQIPESRFNTKGFLHSNGERHGSTNVDKAYLMSEDIKAFDASFFSINPREAEALDPQQRFLLETVYEAMEDSGQTIEGMKGSDTAVYVGVMTGDYLELQIRDPENMPMYMATGTARSIISNRVSYFFDWKGPSVTIDTACSSSLVAVHQAIQSLRQQESKVAIAAGANLILGPEMMISESNLHMLSPTGRSRMWDADADGYARGEGFAAVVMKTLSQALEDGDVIDFIIRETGVNQDGRTQGITMPSATSQAALIQQTYKRAGLDCTKPEDQCQFFEAHGTGTPRGDPLEAKAIRDAFFPVVDGHNSSSNMYVGSVKTVIGHLEGCAGLAGLLKAAEAVRRGEIPPNMHYNKMNHEIIPLSKNLKVPTAVVPWPKSADGSVRRASVNSFGFGGTNAHAIIENYSTTYAHLPVDPPTNLVHLPVPLTFSANSSHSLAALLKEYATLLESNSTLPLQNLACFLASRRTQLPFRISISGADAASLRNGILTAAEKPGVGNRRLPKTDPKLLGVFTGQGAQWANMGRDLILASPLAMTIIKKLDASLHALPDGPFWSMEEELTNKDKESRIHEAALSQPICTAVQIILVELLRAAKVTFHRVIGHSSGEIGAAFAAGILSDEEAIRIAYYRGLHAKLAGSPQGGPGAMMAVGVSMEKARTFIEQNGFKDRIGVAASNGPESVTLSGDKDAVEEAKEILDEQKIFCRLLKVDTAYHSHHMLRCTEAYCNSLRLCQITPRKPASDCTWISSVHGRPMISDDDIMTLTESYWRDNMVQSVLFSQAVLAAHEHGGPFDAGIEVGPHPALKGPVTQTLKPETGANLSYSGTLSRFENDITSFSNALGFIWTEIGSNTVDFRNFLLDAFEVNANTPNAMKHLPRYAWDHTQTFWKESRVSRNYRLRSEPRHDLLGARCTDDFNQEMRWRNTLRIQEAPWLAGHQVQGQVIYPAAAYLVMAMEASKEMDKTRNVALIELHDVSISRAIVLSEEKPVEVMFRLQRQEESSQTITAGFSCHSLADDSGSKWHQNVSGKVTVTYMDSESHDVLPHRAQDQNDASLSGIDINYFYSSLADIGLEYTGLFQRLSLVERRMNKAVGFAREIPNDPELPVTIHPALLDSSFQTIFAAFCWPGDGSLLSPWVPTHINSLRINPRQEQDDELVIDCHITDHQSQTVSADVDIYTSSGKARVQLQGLTCTSLDRPRPADDTELFAKTAWESIVESGLDKSEIIVDKSGDHALVDLCERLSYYYLRHLNSTIDRSEVASMVWNHQRIFEFIDYLFPWIEKGTHPTLRKEWSNDSYDWLRAQVAQYPGQIDLQLITAVGENLPRVVRGQTTMLEHMVENDMLNRFYKFGLGFQRANGTLSKLARRVAHRYPRMNILEIGAGTGGATKGVLEALGDAFANYTFTDISTGFFEHAQEQFKEFSSRMTFRALDIEKDLSTQDIELGKFDMIVASNVLHATKSLQYTMSNVRKLLKPGGYLLLLEVTSDILRVKLMMSGLPGWWLGDQDGRRYGPTISGEEWDTLLKSTGFSGVDQIVGDFQDASKHMTSVMVSQGVDDEGKVSLLRNPLAPEQAVAPPSPGGQLAVVGGKSRPVQFLAREVARRLSSWTTHAPVFFESFADFLLSQSSLDANLSIISLADLDEPVLASLNSDSLAGLQHAFNKARRVLWITSGCRDRNPAANMSVGLGRSLAYEYPHVCMQFLDVDDAETSDFDIATALARLLLADRLELPSDELLWTVEPEISISQGSQQIPRIVPDVTLNNRLNSARRPIFEKLAPAEDIQIIRTDREVYLDRLDLASIKGLPDSVTIRVAYSMLQPIYPQGIKTPLHACIGTIEADPTISVLAFASTIGSVVSAPNKLVLSLSSPPVSRYEFLLLACLGLVAQQALTTVRQDERIVIVNPDDVLSPVIEEQARRRKIGVTRVSTTQPELGQSDTVNIPPFTPSRRIASVLPKNIGLAFDFSLDTQNEALTNYLSETSRLIHSKDIFAASMIDDRSTTTSTIEMGHVFDLHDIAADVLAPNRTNLISVADIGNSSDSMYSYDTIIDFTNMEASFFKVQPTQPAALFKPDRTYLLVGCTGGLGQSLTRWMVENGARYLVLTSRDTSKVDKGWVQGLESMGANISLYSVDISDRFGLQDMHEDISRRLPPVIGVANAAMVLSDRLFGDMSMRDMQSVLRPKVNGTKYLDEIFQKPDLDFFVLFSSLASVVGNRGQSNYGAANLFMTSLAAQRKTKGLAGSVMDIGMVLGVGYVQQTGLYISTLRKFNYMPIAESKFHTMFAEAIIAGRPENDHPAEIITGLHRISDRSSEGETAFWAGNPRFSHYTIQESINEEQVTTTTISTKKRLSGASDRDAAAEIILEGFVAKLERVLQISAENINGSESLIALGVDSLMAVEIRSWFVKEVDVDFPVLKILGGASPLELCTEAAKKINLSVDKPTETSNATQELSKAAEAEKTGSATNIEADSKLSMSSPKPEPSLVVRRALDLSQVPTGSTTPNSECSGFSTPYVESEATGLSSPTSDFETEKYLDTDLASQKLQAEIESVDFERIDEMSYAQQRLWFLRAFLDDPSTYNVTMMYRLDGHLEVSTFENALNSVINKHRPLRSAYFIDPATEKPVQALLQKPNFRLQYIEDPQESDVESEFERLDNYNYDLPKGETMAATVIPCGHNSHVLIVGFHHIAFDGFSAQIFAKDLGMFLAGLPVFPLKNHYTSFAQKQREEAETNMEKEIKYWKSEFEDLPEALPLFGFSQVKSRRPLTTYKTHRVERTISKDLISQFKKATGKSNATLFHGHLTILQILLSRMLKVKQVCIGITDANRTDSAYLDTIGFFVNLLPLRFQIDPASQVSSILQMTSEKVRNALDNSRLPFDVLLDELRVPRSTSESPLFQVLMNYRRGSVNTVTLNGIKATISRFSDAENPYDLVFDVEDRPDGTHWLSLKSQDYLYAQQDLEVILKVYELLLETFSDNMGCLVSKLNLYASADVQSAAALGKGPLADIDDQITIPRRVDDIIRKHSNDVAVKDDQGSSLTYSQLDRRVQFIAKNLQDSGVRASDFVAVHCEPTINSVCYLLAIMRLNAVYVPLDPQNPHERLQLVLDDCKPVALITHAATESSTCLFNLAGVKVLNFENFENETPVNVLDQSKAISPACTLYTSGTTGAPKGIVLRHYNLVNQIVGIKKQFNIGKETVLQQSSLGFDVSLDQMLQPLTAGGTLVVVSRSTRLDAVQLARVMYQEGVTYTYATPSEYATLLRYGADHLKQYTNWKTAFVGGEPLPTHLIRQFHQLGQPHLTLINRYGPTEITVSSSCYAIETWDPACLSLVTVPVGFTQPNYSTYILDGDGNSVPVGFVGEIVIGGCGVARGYLGKDKLTEQKFSHDMFADEQYQSKGWITMYHTGDKGRLLPDGNIICLGRMDGDHQIKLRGFRIELDDIANTVLNTAKGRLADAAVCVRGEQDEDGDRRFLVAFVTVAADESTEETDSFLQKLRYKLPLPAYMIPSRLVPLSDLPRNPNGKLDRRALDKITLPDVPPTESNDRPFSDTESVIARIWKNVLNTTTLTTSFTRDSDFFQVGGNSLLMVRVHATICDTLGTHLPLIDLFQASTLGGMAARIYDHSNGSRNPCSEINWHQETELSVQEEELFTKTKDLPPHEVVGQETLEVVLTGATGFLGSAILQQLVNETSISRIHCIAVRDCPRKLAVDSDKIVQYPGDLCSTRLGLNDSTWCYLAERVDSIIHNGADVSFLKSYQSLRKPNLQSTRELVALAANRKIPFHYISTGGVAHLLHGSESLPPKSVAQHFPTADGSDGYVASKWASERYLELCHDKSDIKYFIHRPSSITGDGVPATDLVQSIIQVAVMTGNIPALEGWTGAFDFVPVETVARGVWDAVKHSVSGTSPLKELRIIHHCGVNKVPINSLAAYLETKYHKPFQTVDVDTWLIQARQTGVTGALESIIVNTLKHNTQKIVPSLSRS